MIIAIRASRAIFRATTWRAHVTPEFLGPRPKFALPPLPSGGPAFHTSPQFLKKKDKSLRGDAPSSTDPPAASSDAADITTPFDRLDADIKKLMDQLTADLSKIRVGSTDPAILESISVVTDKASSAKTPLKEIAHVVTKGRSLAVTVYDAANVKRVVSAIQVSQLNMQPVVDAKNPQVVNVPCPPPTKESRNEMAERIKKIGLKTQEALKAARGTINKKLQAAKDARRDDRMKAEKKMEEIVKKQKVEIENVVERARKNILEG